MKYRNILTRAVLIFLTAAGLSCLSAGGRQELLPEDRSITVFAAASLTNVMEEAGELYREKTGVEVKLNSASSSILARQIESGAEADLYFSANVKWMTYLTERDLADSSRTAELARGELVLIIPAGSSPPEIRFEPDFPVGGAFEGRLSLGDPDHVPAGQYAAEALKSLGWYDVLAPRFLPAADVRAALMAVESGEISLGIVYSTDAAVSPDVEILAVFPRELYPPVLYQGTVLPGAGAAAEGFFSFMVGPEGRMILKKYGFGIPGEQGAS